MPGKKRRRPRGTAIAAYTIAEFCAAHDIARSTYYQMRQVGTAPREMHVGRQVRISQEAAADWRRDREKHADRLRS